MVNVAEKLPYMSQIPRNIYNSIINMLFDNYIFDGKIDIVEYVNMNYHISS